MRPHRLLFVCMGNICRSPAGEAVMRHLVEAEGLAERIECDSVGTIAFHTGNPPDHRMHTAAANRGINTGGQARQICDDDYHSFDDCKRAVDEYRARHAIDEEIVRIDGLSCFWRRRTNK